MARATRHPFPSDPRSRDQATHLLLARLADTAAEADAAEIVDELVHLNMGLCRALARRYANRGADLDDLIQVALVGLVLAIRRFDAGDGRSFVAFAVPTITGELRRHFRDHCWAIRPPRGVQELRARTTRERDSMSQRIGREPREDEIARELGVEPGAVREALHVDDSYRPRSLDAMLGGGTMSLGDTVADPDDPMAGVELRLVVGRVLDDLSPVDRRVLWWRFGEECTQREIAVRMGISQMQVSRILRRILTQCRENLAA